MTPEWLGVAWQWAVVSLIAVGSVVMVATVWLGIRQDQSKRQ
jgi:hypothetical protein